MAEERPTTPEKQLLDLIEDPKEQDLSQKKIKRGSLGLFSFAAFKGRLSFLLESLRSGSFFKKAFFDIKGINKVLKICVALLLVYLVGNFGMSIVRLKEIPDFATKSPKSSTEMPVVGITNKKISDYLEGPRSRNIFKFADAPREEIREEDDEIEEVAPPEEETLSEAELLAEQLGLVGIGWSDNPDVMIENVTTKKIYFLKRGERIDGLIKVEAIFQERVILTYDNGKEMELR